MDPKFSGFFPRKKSKNRSKKSLTKIEKSTYSIILSYKWRLYYPCSWVKIQFWPMNMGSTTSIYGIKWPNRSIFRIRFFLFFVKNIFNRKPEKSIFSLESRSLLNKPLEKFRMPGFQNIWSYGMSIRAQTLNFFSEIGVGVQGFMGPWDKGKR